MELGHIFPSISLGWMELGPTNGTGSHFPSILLDKMELGPTFPSNLLGWMELGSIFPAFCLIKWNWVPFSQHYAGVDGTGSHFDK